LATRDVTAGGPQPEGRAGAPALRPSRRRWGEDLVRVSLLLCAAVSVATTVGIVIALVEPAIEFFREINFVDFITGTRWAPLFANPDFGVLPLLAGTFSVTIWASLVCIPFGLGAAIYLSEYAHPRVRKTLKPMLELLAGIPTVVFGYFALLLVTPLLEDIGIDVSTFNALSAGLVVGILVLPTVASLSEDAMTAVPMDLRAGAYALGGTRLKVSTRVVGPAAISGIIASFVLAVSRIVGETMVVLIAGGGQPQLTLDPREQIQTMTAFIGATGQGDVPTGSIEYKTIFAVGLTLFVITLVMNVISIRLVRKYRYIYE
jgi:phosphate transport system permease protein